VAVHQLSVFAIGDPAVDTTVPFERRQLEHGAWVDVARGFLHGADDLLDRLTSTVEWRQGRRWMYDRMVDDPRLSRWYARTATFPHQVLHGLRDELQAHYGVELGGVGLNYYRDGHDSVAPHADRELRRLDDTLVAIVTLGARRPFLVRPRSGGASIDLAPGSGDLLVMGGACQLHYEHAVPKVARAGPRISCSYRWSSEAGAVTRLQNA
jgi:alkylated DNA repair dioxygenase AlkB